MMTTELNLLMIIMFCISQPLLFRPSQSLVHVQSILDEASRISAHLPNVAALRSAVEMATRWITSVDRLLVKASFYH